MKLFDGGKAPNPRRVRVFLAEKGLEVPMVRVDMAAFEHKQADVSTRNPLQRLPVLELDDGTILTESVAICRYFEELHPEPALFGRGALGKALVEMWQRRIELNLFLPVGFAFRHIHPAMKEWEVPQVPEWGEVNKPKVIDFLALLDRELAAREFAAGDQFSVADITGLIAIDFMKPARISVPEEFSNVRRWHAALAARPSAAT
ncbi:glutathione S-transferase [Aminobacter sp. Piv2-1]|uniref:glutathione S-transferase n=1 Tax=Aminobacter sp. Piv2-1 TaxID=3031122 RepID=UPI0030ACDF64